MKNEKMNSWLVNEIEVIYRTGLKRETTVKIENAKNAVEELEPYFKQAMEFKELFYCMYLNNNNEVLGIYKISEGGTISTVVDIKIILGTGLKILAQSMIIAHNHPSGKREPSNADHKITQAIRKGAKLFDMEVIDHIILTKNGYTSMANEGMMEL